MTQAILDKIRSQIADNIYLGASLAIFTDGQWQEHYIGYITETESVRPDLVYDMASVSKVIGVGAIVIDLIQTGKLELDKPLQFYYPAFLDSTVTIRQLLTHTSGIDPFIPNRDKLSAAELVAAIHRIKVTEDKSFLYTDINFLLLGFLLEEILGQPLDVQFAEKVFAPLDMHKTSFGPRSEAVPTIKGLSDGLVHDPKAKVLGVHTGSAGLFSTLADMKRFCTHYMTVDVGLDLLTNYGSPTRPRSLGWDLSDTWLVHTGYTGPFIMVNRKTRQSVIFLTNRTYLCDDRALWIEQRQELMAVMKQSLESYSSPL